MPTLGGVLEFEVEVVVADVPLLIGLDLLGTHNLVVNNFGDVSDCRSVSVHELTGEALGKMPLTRNYEHL
jgi:hypothetical protein